MAARPLPARRQALQAAQHEGGPPFRIDSVIQPQVRDPPKQGRDRDFGLDPRQLGAEAEVDAAAKGQRLHIGPGDIQPLRVVGIDRRVVVGGAEQAQHALALRDAFSAEIVDVFQRHPAGQLHREIVAQEFLDGVGGQLGPGLEQRELVGIAMQRQQAVADQVDRGFMARAEQQDDIGGQFLVGELAAVLLGLHQLRDQVVAGVSFAAARTSAGNTSPPSRCRRCPA